MAIKTRCWELQWRMVGDDEWITYKRDVYPTHFFPHDQFDPKPFPEDYDRSKDRDFPEFWIEYLCEFSNGIERKFRIIETDIVTLSVEVDRRIVEI